MAKGRHLNVILDQELDALLRQDAQLRGISVSAAVRDALRAYFQVADVGDRAWREAYLAAYRAIQKQHQEALASLPQMPPDDWAA